ncbi:MAG: hypothetical protein K5770_15175 [Lachnospiraceae bacterium]|nr:hypothetical protein [Lachnospiraceae bacterium]
MLFDNLAVKQLRQSITESIFEEDRVLRHELQLMPTNSTFALANVE